jgi:RNA polymerase sigma factor (sigma-70 family)
VSGVSDIHPELRPGRYAAVGHEEAHEPGEGVRRSGAAGGKRSSDVTPSVIYDSLEQACAVEYPRLARWLTLYCGDRETALDLAQETCARACSRWSSVSQMRDQRAWFTKVAMNLSRSRWRHQVVERRVLAIFGSRAPIPAEADIAGAVTVRTALARLTPRQRAAVVLRYFDDLDLEAAAAVLGCSAGTVKKLTSRGIATLRNELEVDVDSGDGDD